MKHVQVSNIYITKKLLSYKFIKNLRLIKNLTNGDQTKNSKLKDFHVNYNFYN